MSETEDMVERVAAVIRGYCNSGRQFAFADAARAAIEAMREPTVSMRIDKDGSDRWNWTCNTCGGPQENWHRMINAALQGKAT